MKATLKIVPLLLLFVLSSCEKLDYKNSDVQDYVYRLKSGSPDAYNMPDFTSSDIPALLVYRNDTTDIFNVPQSPISSFSMDRCKLGMVILWNIESIRLQENHSDMVVGKYPSMNPVLALKDNPAKWLFDTRAQIHAADAYYDWWMSVSIFRDKMKKNPLSKTNYVWH